MLTLFLQNTGCKIKEIERETFINSGGDFNTFSQKMV